MYGTQTTTMTAIFCIEFENDVKMYGTQTIKGYFQYLARFENDVKMYGTQTLKRLPRMYICLRMM